MSRSTCDHTVERLPWWLNGTLEEGEAHGVEAHLAECSACSDELAATWEALGMVALHLPIETLLDRVEDAAAADYRTADGTILSRRTVEDHLAHCLSCRDEIALLRDSRSAMDADPAQSSGGVTPFTRRSRPQPSPGLADRRSLALAASLLLFVIAAGGWLLTGRVAEERGDRVAELEGRLAVVSEDSGSIAGEVREEGAPGDAALAAEAERLAERVSELEREVEMARRVTPPRPIRLAEAIGVGPTFSWRVGDSVVRGGRAEGDEEITVPADAEEVSLFIEGVGEGPLRLRIEDSAGRRILERDGLRPFDDPLLGRHLTLTLPVAGLPPGPLGLRLFAGDREVGSLLVRVER